MNFKKDQVLLQPKNNMNLRNKIIFSFRLDPEIRMQSRSLRAKNLGYLMLFMAWYTGVGKQIKLVLFIMYRLKSDDLDTLEKEAEERIKI